MKQVTAARIATAAMAQATDQAMTALRNELVTRERVGRLEQLLGRGFFGRLRWLLLGR